MFIKDFTLISKDDTPIAGGKGASLGEMTRAGIPVPTGFVVLANAFEHFLEETDLSVEIDSILHTVDQKEIHTVENASERIQGLILDATMPKDIAQETQQKFRELDAEFVAVRSSATAEDSSTAAWAGQLESFLNTTKENLLKNVQRCWASLFTPRAIFYRFEKGLHDHKISVAVVVQKMVASESSGIAFSVHPVTEDYNQLIIEAGWGLGEAIVSGQITPNSYVVEKEPRRIIDKNIAEQTRGLFRASLPAQAGQGGNEWRDVPKEQGEAQVLSDAEILQLTELILKIEQHYNFPVDVEWAREDGKFYIVQSRPITTLSTPVQASKSVVTMLSKIYSREKTLFYFSMWNDSDRMGWKSFLGHDVNCNLFIVPPPGQKGSVWYVQEEFSTIDKKLKEKLKTDPAIVARLVATLEANWEKIEPYLTDKKNIQSSEEFDSYYKSLVVWWSAMNTAFGIPDMEDVGAATRETFLSWRVQSERYTEKMNKLMVSFFQEHFPELRELYFCVTPREVIKLASGYDEKLVATIKERKDGCIMLNEQIYPLRRLRDILAEHHISLEEVTVDKADIIKGSPAYKGKVVGRVAKILSFADMKKLQAGNILVTEMTNPDYVPIMKLAGAIVTDEGGATCHAAIASREFQVPCIVGTQIATKVLKDGDLVEVDADRGVVRIIEANH
ncbi:MAG: pyruvate, water dikinase [Parcubacteria group bacterium Gr01-1014_29]|nr:MAG: pyruvate, water dikinase [Parcubacteria group bacterium Gr01-1014_29]